MVNWGTVTPIVVAIIGISGVVLPAASSFFINQFYNKPNVNAVISQEQEKGKQIINITNSGTIPATNLSLMITASNHTINNITNLLSTTNVFLVNQGRMSLFKINQLNTTNSPALRTTYKKIR